MEFSTDPQQIIQTVSDGSLTLAEIIKRYEISNIIRRFGQWVVTEYGLECLVAQYQLPINKLIEQDWSAHMSEKRWVKADEFDVALQFAQDHFSVKPEIMPEIAILSNNESAEPMVDSYTAKRLYQSLISIHEAYIAGEKHIPNDIPRPNNAPASFSVKEDFILSPLYSGFAILFHAFLISTGKEYLLEQFRTETLLNLTTKQFRHLTMQVLNKAYENGAA